MPTDLYAALTGPPSQAVLMTAKELGIEVNCKPVNVIEGEQNESWFIKMNPQHCVPTIDDDGFYLWESRAIMTYLVNKYAPDSSLYPKDPQKRAIVDRMLYFDIGMYKSQREYFYPYLVLGEKPDPEKEAIYKKVLDLLNSFLEGTPYAAGTHRTLADISLLATLSVLELADYSLSCYTNIVAWLSRIKSELPYFEEICHKHLMEHKELLKSRREKISADVK